MKVGMIEGKFKAFGPICQGTRSSKRLFLRRAISSGPFSEQPFASAHLGGEMDIKIWERNYEHYQHVI